MEENIKLNVSLLRKRVPNLTSAAKSVGLRPATVSNLCTGKIPVGKAQVRTLVSLAELANCSLDELIIRGGKSNMIETGIKSLDVFAPVIKGGVIGFVARPGMGQLAVLGEFVYRMKEKGFKTIMLRKEELDHGIEDVLSQVDFHSADIQEIEEKIAEYRKSNDIIFGIDREIYLTDAFLSLQENIDSTNGYSVTYAVVDTTGNAVDEELPYGPLDTLWRFDMELVVKRFFPAVDALQSTSTILEGFQLEQAHLEVQHNALKVLRRYRELKFIVDKWGMDRLSSDDQNLFKSGERLEAYLTQPFYIAEEFTKKQGVYVTRETALEDIKKIINHSLNEQDVNEFLYIGQLA